MDVSQKIKILTMTIEYQEVGVHILIGHPQQWECQALIMGSGM